MPHLFRIVLSLAGAGQAQTNTRPVFHALPTSALLVEGKSCQLIQKALATRGSPQLPRTLWSRSRTEPDRDIQPVVDPGSDYPWRYFPL